jgi:hypothetical protein
VGLQPILLPRPHEKPTLGTLVQHLRSKRVEKLPHFCARPLLREVVTTTSSHSASKNDYFTQKYVIDAVMETK